MGASPDPASSQPLGIRQAGPRELEIRWADGHTSLFPVRHLRLACRCASCTDERTGAPLLDPASVAEDVKPVRIEPVGRYAIHIAWSDGHTTGIHSFEYLRSICPCPECVGRTKSE